MSAATVTKGKRSLAVAAAVIAVLWVLAFRWWTTPSIFRDHGDGVSAAPAQVSEAPLHVGVTNLPLAGKAQTVRLNSARAHTSADGARVRASFSICKPRAGEGPIIASRRDLVEYCSAVRPLSADSSMVYGPDGEYIVMTLQPTQVGVTRVDGVDIDYGRGWNHLFQHGNQRVAVGISLTAR